ncbi:MAG: multiple sugar transport system permease protein [Chloroflexota bacterium]|nr:multiple sugar transport system permease protein [Chloroflexota bacterium]
MALSREKRPAIPKYRQKESRTAWLFSAPAIILLVLFLVVPFIWAIWLSFTNQRLIPNPNLPTEFVGLRNFLRLFQDATFKRGLLNNFYFIAVVVPLQTSLALALAMLINQPLKGMNIFRTIYFGPVVTAMTVVSIVWTLLYNPGEGLINAFLQAISFGKLGPYNWLLDTKLVFPAIMLLSIWQGVGFQMVIYLAGLQEIPHPLYEAAQVDGANGWQQFIHITLPQLRNTTIFVVLSTTIMAFKLFDQVQVMTNGGPQNASMTTMVYVVEMGWGQLKVGYASAISIVFFLIVMCVTLIQRYLTREKKGSAA